MFLSIALGMAVSTDEQVISLDGDGSLLMNLGSHRYDRQEQPKNLIVVVWDNEKWDQTGHQPSHTAMGTDLEKVAQSCSIAHTATVTRPGRTGNGIPNSVRGRWSLVHRGQDRVVRTDANLAHRAGNDPVPIPQLFHLQ